MIQTYSKALAPGTYANREKQARCYVTFAVLYNVPYLYPFPVHVCMFYQYLTNKLNSLSAIKNYISGARTWVTEHGGNTIGFSGYEQSMMMKAITKDSSHVVKRAFPLTFSHISLIASYLDSARNVPLCIKPCLLIGYSCYLRSSNLVSPNVVLWGGHHTLLVNHVIDKGDRLVIIVPSTKTTSAPYSVVIPMFDNPHVCPVRSWRRYVTTVNPPFNAPAFVLSNAAPLTSTLLVRLMKDALSGLPDVDTSAISMHSIRRGAAQQAARNGAPLDHIMERGGWVSKSGIKPYLSQ